MIPYMVGKLAPNSSHLIRGLVKYVPGRSYFCAVSSKNGDIFVTSPPPQSLNGFFREMYGVAENACCRSTMSESDVRHHREGGRDDSEPERLDRGALGDKDSPTSTEITNICTNGKGGKNERSFHAGAVPTDQLDIQVGTS